MNLLDLVVKVSVDDQASSKIGPLSDGLKGKLATAAKAGAVAIAAVTAAAAGMTKALISGVNEVAEYGDNVDKMSQKMGISATAYQEWDAVMRHSGTSMESLKASMKTLANAVENGNEAFERIGITQEQIASMNQEELFAATIEGLQNVTDETERTYLAGQLLGRGATELGPLLNMSAEETQAMKDRVHELGGVMSDEAVKSSAAFKDSLQDLNTAMAGIKRNVLSEFLPGLTLAMDGLQELLVGDMDKGAEMLAEGVEQVLSKIEEVAPKLMEIIGRITETVAPLLIESIGMLVATMASQIVSHLPEILEMGLQLIGKLLEGLVNGIAPFMEQVNEFMQGVLDSIGEFFMGMFQSGAELIDNLLNGAAQIAKNIPKTFGDWIRSGLKAITGFLGSMLSAGTNLWSNLKSGAAAIGNTIAGVFGGWIQSGLSNILGFVGSMLSAGASLISNLLRGATSIGSTIASTFTGWISSAVSSIRSYVSTFFNAGASILGGFIDGIKSGFDRAVGAVSEGLENIRSYLPFSPAKKGPFSGRGWTLYSGMSLMEGLAEGIEAASDTAERSMLGAIADVHDAMDGYTAAVSMPVSTTYSRAGSNDAVIAWLSENLGDIIADYTPVMSRRDFDRMARGAVA